MAIFDNMPTSTKKFKDSISEGQAMMEEQKKTETPAVEEKKETKKTSFLDTIIVGKPEDIKNHIVKNILIPTVKQMATDICEIIFYGPNGVTNKNPKTIDKVSYASCYKDGKSQPIKAGTTGGSKQNVSGFVYEDIVCDKRDQIENIIETANQYLSRYNVLSVLELYDIAGDADGKPYTFSDFGWSNITLGDEHIVKLADNRYMLKMPEIKPIKGVNL